jgi:hypothetical protein
MSDSTTTRYEPSEEIAPTSAELPPTIQNPPYPAFRW